MSTVRIVIFAKAPRPGQAKTRLIPALGAAGAAALAERMLLQTVRQTELAQLGRVELCCTPRDDPAWRRLNLPESLRMTEQGTGSLGERMARASQRVLSAHESVLLIGTDCPGLTAERLREVAKALRTSDAVMVPAVDGGYVAIGLRRFDPRVFEDIPWGTSEVAARTLARFTLLRWRHHVLAAEHDIDEPSDLQHLPNTWRTPPGTRTTSLPGSAEP
ncbi:MAG: TIGR04282 family arsenosugar biosynthesis glycosyltransferase [Pseudomonadota bacterium]